MPGTAEPLAGQIGVFKGFFVLTQGTVFDGLYYCLAKKSKTPFHTVPAGKPADCGETGRAGGPFGLLRKKLIMK
jgi:hypothetical protein